MHTHKRTALRMLNPTVKGVAMSEWDEMWRKPFDKPELVWGNQDADAPIKKNNPNNTHPKSDTPDRLSVPTPSPL
jgi:hypothetical protein